MMRKKVTFRIKNKNMSINIYENIDVKYEDLSKIIYIQCKKKHNFEATKAMILDGFWCPECGKN